ncbi:MAG: DUF2017 family protein [Acidimicrobiales bacterium]
MALRGRRLVERERSGRGYKLRLGAEERQVIATLADQLGELMESDAPLVKRLFPTAYLTDPDKDLEYQLLARAELLDHRNQAVDTVRSTIDSSRLTPEELEAWMNVVNSIRLVLGTRLDVSEDDDGFSLDDADAPVQAVYHFLGWLLEEMVRAVSA